MANNGTYFETYTNLHRKEYLRTRAEIQGCPFQTCWTQDDGQGKRVFEWMWSFTAQAYEETNIYWLVYINNSWAMAKNKSVWKIHHWNISLDDL